VGRARMRIEERRLDGLVRGAVGSLAGLLAMALFFRGARAWAERWQGSAAEEERADDGDEGALDDISVAGQKTREDEPATEMVARLGYETVAGDEPDEETRRRLGQAVHWGYGILLGGLYGALRSRAEGPDLLGGLGYGTAAWLLGDEIMVPMLGLARGPTAHPWSDHAMALGAHLAYGAATSTATQALKRLM
jgi:uncharacterized membrane protein YagU involved in acid resistance